MVEAPRIRIIYEKINFTKNKKIIAASGPTYKKIGVDMVGYTIRKWWFAGKYIYTYIIKKTSPSYVIRTHMLMYGKILLNEKPFNPKLKPFLVLELSDGNTLSWYLSQIKLLDPKCTIDEIKSNYTSENSNICSSKQAINDSIIMMQYDVSNKAFNLNKYMPYLESGIKLHHNDIMVDFLLNQKYFPGVGNILQQEALYRCRILPITKVSNIQFDQLNCLVTELKNVIQLLYKSYLDKLENKPRQPILQIYHKKYCPLGHKTETKYLGFRHRRTTWCPICQI